MGMSRLDKIMEDFNRTHERMISILTEMMEAKSASKDQSYHYPEIAESSEMQMDDSDSKLEGNWVSCSELEEKLVKQGCLGNRSKAGGPKNFSEGVLVPDQKEGNLDGGKAVNAGRLEGVSGLSGVKGGDNKMIEIEVKGQYGSKVGKMGVECESSRRPLSIFSMNTPSQLTLNSKTSWALGSKWAGLARPFGTKPAGNDVIGIDLGTRNSCVTIMEGKNPKVLIENACCVDCMEEALNTLLPMLPSVQYFRFSPVDECCGMELDETDPVVWLKLEDAADEYTVQNQVQGNEMNEAYATLHYLLNPRMVKRMRQLILHKDDIQTFNLEDKVNFRGNDVMD